MDSPDPVRGGSPRDPVAGRARNRSLVLGGGLTGDLDEVAVFDEALSPAEVTLRLQPADR